MPGDCHIHMILDGVYYRTAIDAQAAHPDEALIHSRLRAYADEGINFLRDGGDAWGVALCAARLAKAYSIDYRTPSFPIHKRGRYGGFIGKGFETMQEYAALVEKAAADGADFIKLMLSGLMDFDHYGVITSAPLEEEELGEMITIAHRAGFAVMAHANGTACIRAALKAGVDSIEHGAYMDDETLKLLAKSDAVWVPTLATIGNLIGDGRYPDTVLCQLLDLQLRNLGSCAAMGGRIALGSDAGAYRVAHVQGTMDEYALLARALGEHTDEILLRGEQAIRARFGRG